MQQVAAGASFVTSGPILFLDVNGRSPGDFLNFSDEDRPEVEARIKVSSPLHPVRYIEVVQDGRVVERRFNPHERTSWEFVVKLPVRESGWIAARAYGDAGTEAHTNPIYLFLNGKRPFSEDACDQIIARLAGSIRTIPNVKIRNQLEQIANRLRDYRDRGDSEGLGLPSVP